VYVLLTIHVVTKQLIRDALVVLTVSNTGLLLKRQHHQPLPILVSVRIVYLNIILAVRSINFSFFDKIDLSSIKYSTNDEMTMEFWFYVYSYSPAIFTSLDVSWHHHVRIQLINVSGVLKSRCYPFVDYLNLPLYTGYAEENKTEKVWFYVRCAADRYTQKFYLNNNSEIPVPSPIPPFVKGTSTTLSIVDNVLPANNNYGFSFVRELKLYSCYNFGFYDASRL